MERPQDDSVDACLCQLPRSRCSEVCIAERYRQLGHGVDGSAGQRERGEYRQGEEEHGLVPEDAGELGIDDEEAFSSRQ